jgi:hypothetical protein
MPMTGLIETTCLVHVAPPSVVDRIDWIVPVEKGPLDPDGGVATPSEHTVTEGQENGVSGVPAAGIGIVVHEAPPLTVL